MTRKITDIRPVGIAPNLVRLIADVQDAEGLLAYSVEIDELTADELIIYAVTDPAHILNAQTEVDWGETSEEYKRLTDGSSNPDDLYDWARGG